MDESPFVDSKEFIDCVKDKLETASKQLRRKIPCTGHLMTPRHLWIQTVPTKDCDIVMTFPSIVADEILMWLLSRLRSTLPGLIVSVKFHPSTNTYAFYITASIKALLKAAEEVHLAKLLKSEYGGGLKEFVRNDLSCFEGIESDQNFFTTQERQSLVLHLLETLRAVNDDEFPGLKFVNGQAIIPKCLSSGIITQIFPIHEPDDLKKLQLSWVCKYSSEQPLSDICKYFGVKVAMYFAWLGHYTTALSIPAIMGLIVYFGFGRGDQAIEDIGFVIFSFFNILWFSIYVETWKRYCAELAYKWGTIDQRNELLIKPRPLFIGTLQISSVTGRLEPYYPNWKRNLFRYFISIPIICLCLSVVFIVMVLNFKLQDWLDQQIELRGYVYYLSYLPKIMLAIGITLLDEAYYKVAIWLNDRENYRLDTKYENHLIVKVALFQFVNSFLSLFYIAFYLQDQEKLKEQLAGLLIARQVIGNIKESALPYVLEQFRLAKMSFDMFGALSPSEERKLQDDGSKKDRNISQAELESSLFKYEGTFSDHLEMYIQLGYVVLFSSAFPLAAFCALINNLIEIRSDAFKLCYIFQRPFGQRVPNIGTWQNAMEVMGLIAVIVNCTLIALSGQVQRMFPEMSTTQTILLIVTLEHLMLLLRFVVKIAIPDIPEWVATEMAKVEFARREAVKNFSNSISVQKQSPSFIGRIARTNFTDEVDNEEKVDEKKLNSTPEKLLKDKKSQLELNTKQLWLQKESVPEHLATVGPHTSSIQWIRKLALDGGRKTSEPNMGTRNGSTDNLVVQKEAAASDPELFRSAQEQTWSNINFAPENTTEVQNIPKEVEQREEDITVKKQRLKQSLIKRARSVAIFSLKLKEKRAAAGAVESKSKEKSLPLTLPLEQIGGELSCIPIEKLISVEDINLRQRRSTTSNDSSSSQTK